MTEIFRLDGRRALVTGASRGIGRSIALGLAAAGADVAVSARSTEALTGVAKEIAALGRDAPVLTADLLDPAATSALPDNAAAVLGGLDLLVHCGGSTLVDDEERGIALPVHGVSDAQWLRVQDLSLTAAFRLCRGAYPHLQAAAGHTAAAAGSAPAAGRAAQAGSGASVTIVSSIGGLASLPHQESYGAAKAAQISLVRSLAAAWAQDGIRVNALCPGWVRTQLTAALVADAAVSEVLLSRVPQRRWAEPDELAGPAVFLASPAASFLTGHALVVDGGLGVNQLYPA